MALGLQCITEGPDELEILIFSLSRKSSVQFTLPNSPEKPSFWESGLCRVSACRRVDGEERDHLLGLPAGLSVFRSGGEVFEIEVPLCQHSSFRSFSAFYSPKDQKGLVIWLDDGTCREVFINT
jgi:hypothetical protein